MTLSTPQAVEDRLEAIERDLAELQNELEDAAFAWFRAKREREKARAEAFLTAKGSVAARQAMAEAQTATDGMIEEATWEAKKAVARTLESRASIGQSILKAQGRS